MRESFSIRDLLVVSLIALCGPAACSRPSERPAADKSAIEKSGPEITPATDLQRAQVEAIEAGLARNLDDLITRERLLLFYLVAGDKVFGQKATVEARRRHILWVIEHHPESKVARSRQAWIHVRSDQPDADPVGYREGRRLWLVQAGRPGAPDKVLTGAGRFLQESDKQLAEKLYLRAKAQSPQGPWDGELGRLYSEILVGAQIMSNDGMVRIASLSDAHGAYAIEVRKKLAATTDPTLLTVVAQSLALLGPPVYQSHGVDFDPMVLAKTYLARALQLDPQSIFTHQIVLSIRFRERGGIVPRFPKDSSPEAEYRRLAALPDAQRFLPISLLAETTFTNAEEIEASGRGAPQAKASWEVARKCAQQAMQLAAKFPEDSDSGTAIYNANMVLGLLARRDGDRHAAVHFMLEASQATPSNELAYSMSDFTLNLPERLYQDGEHDTVAQFLERFAQGNISSKGYLLESAKAIRAGEKPLWVVK